MDISRGNIAVGSGSIAGPDISNSFSKNVTDIRVVELFFLLIFIWILVDLWVRFVWNLCIRTLGLNEKNTLHTFIIALSMSVIIVGFIIFAGVTTQEAAINTGIFDKSFGADKVIAGGGNGGSRGEIEVPRVNAGTNTNNGDGIIDWNYYQGITKGIKINNNDKGKKRASRSSRSMKSKMSL
jgi:hypothetical protein